MLFLKSYDCWGLNHDLQIVKADITVPLRVQSFINEVYFPGWLSLNWHIVPPPPQKPLPEMLAQLE